jgi:hypothetical protein
VKYYLKKDMKRLGIDKRLVLDYAGASVCVVRSVAYYYPGGAKEITIPKDRLLNEYREVSGDEAKMWFKEYYIDS